MEFSFFEVLLCFCEVPTRAEPKFFLMLTILLALLCFLLCKKTRLNILCRFCKQNLHKSTQNLPKSTQNALAKKTYWGAPERGNWEVEKHQKLYFLYIYYVP